MIQSKYKYKYARILYMKIRDKIQIEFRLIERRITNPFIKIHVSDMEFQMRLLLRCIHHFESDFINNMDHMRISGTEPSSVILSQNKVI